MFASIIHSLPELTSGQLDTLKDCIRNVERDRERESHWSGDYSDDSESYSRTSRRRCTVVVTKLSPRIRYEDIHDLFSRYGVIVRIWLTSSRSYVEYEDERDACDALELDGYKLANSRIRVSWM